MERLWDNHFRDLGYPAKLFSGFAHAADPAHIFSPLGIEVLLPSPQVRDQVLRGMCALCAPDLGGIVLDFNSLVS